MKSHQQRKANAKFDTTHDSRQDQMCEVRR
jgi:hypothetical protein